MSAEERTPTQPKGCHRQGPSLGSALSPSPEDCWLHILCTTIPFSLMIRSWERGWFLPQRFRTETCLLVACLLACLSKLEGKAWRCSRFVLLSGCLPCRHSQALNKMLKAMYKRTGLIQLRVPGNGWIWYWWWSCSKWEVGLRIPRDHFHLMSLGSSFHMPSALCSVT